MRFNKIVFIGLMVLVMAFAAVNVTAQEMSEEDKKMMAAMQAYGTPGEYHKYLEYFAGDWEQTSKMWMKPGDPPMEGVSTASAKMILGGRYLKTKYKGSAMGMPFEGINITAYNNLQKKFHSFWIDSMGTGFAIAHGQLDKSKKVRTETGEWDDPMTGGTYKAKMVTTVIDDNTFTFEMYMIMPDGKEFKSMIMTCKRKK